MNKKIADILIGLSVIAAIIAGYVFFFKQDVIAIAGTQWILVAIALGIYGLYARERTA
ncbi:MAG TPA: hypothetical protein VK255_01400 [Patescibacteria group bacterium]|nr:hypothetical protein [Patescibacteria group bacterium]